MDLNDCFLGMLCCSNHRNLVVSIQAYGLVFQSFTENPTLVTTSLLGIRECELRLKRMDIVTRITP